jgi:hypothetical protein
MNAYSFLISTMLKQCCASQRSILITDYRREVTPPSLMHIAHRGETEDTKIETSLLSQQL